MTEKKEDKKKQQIEKLYAQLGRLQIQKEEHTIIVEQTIKSMQNTWLQIKELQK